MIVIRAIIVRGDTLTSGAVGSNRSASREYKWVSIYSSRTLVCQKDGETDVVCSRQSGSLRFFIYVVLYIRFDTLFSIFGSLSDFAFMRHCPPSYLFSLFHCYICLF